MYSQRQKFEIYLELLTQVSYGNCNYSGLKKCTQLTSAQLDQTLGVLTSEKLLVKTEPENTQKELTVYKITAKGKQFIDITKLAFNYVEYTNDEERRALLPEYFKKNDKKG